jgi:hypothetical protein
MAFTKAPVNDAHNTVRVPVSGEAFVVSNHLLDEEATTANYHDCFPTRERQFNDNPRVTVQKREAWLKAAAASGTVTSLGVMGKMLVMAPDAAYPNVFFAKQSNYYMFNHTTFTVSSVTSSTAAAQAQYAAGTVAVDSTNVKRICFLDGNDELKTFLQDGTSVTTTTTGRSLTGLKGLVFLNGYLFAADTTGYKIFNSTAAGVLTTWSSTDFIAAEQYADPIQYLDKHRNSLVVFGTQSVEFFHDAGIEVGSPLARQEQYSRQIGLHNSGGYAGKVTAHVDDDIYFLGKKDNAVLSLYRIRNFQVEEIHSAYLNKILNTTDTIVGIETMVINGYPMIILNTSGVNYDIVYFPQENTWWLMRVGDPASVDFPTQNLRMGTMWVKGVGIQMFLGQLATDATALYYFQPDEDHTVSLTAKITSQVIDLGINFYKQICRVDAVGDFGSNNTLTLKYRPSSNYETDLVTCSPDTSPTTDDRALSWYNLGGFRRFSLELTIAGYDHAVFEGYDIEYNVGTI